uniref:Uncharacterized protein n=1 Tax=Anopheles quadriannulatus TaxID=34691 RepID=A0A182XTE5_ANOQN
MAHFNFIYLSFAQRLLRYDYSHSYAPLYISRFPYFPQICRYRGGTCLGLGKINNTLPSLSAQYLSAISSGAVHNAKYENY